MVHTQKSNLCYYIIMMGIAVTLASPSRAAADPVHHDLKVTVEPQTHRLSVQDTITIPEGSPGEGRRRVHFELHAGLHPVVRTRGASIKRESRAPRIDDFTPGTRSTNTSGSAPLELFTLKLPGKQRTVTVEYAGEIFHPLAAEGEEYSRDFAQTPGIISADGVYLSGSSVWVPWFGDDPVTFDLEVALPPGWDAVSQGDRKALEQTGVLDRSSWSSPEPQSEVYLIAGPLVTYNRRVAGVDAMAFLRSADEALAGKYLEATGRYLEMYNRLLGPYPYRKFALVENFWETGYGMPSFTLLGSKIIRFPFILTSSYPHEILHNWWGNGVFVDYERGNWCEGLTAYLSDFLFQEQQGKGLEYRQQTLQKYTDYASRDRDFPLAEFRERHSAATEAIGYGKSLMLWHMLRLELGDRTFTQGLREFYKTNIFKNADFTALRRALEQAAGRSLEPLFDQWVTRGGAPRLRVTEAQVRPDGDGFVVTGRLEQVQPGAPFLLSVPIAVTVEGREQALESTVRMTERTAAIEVRVPGRPLRLDVDPAFDVFRTLDRNETPPSLSGLFGADRVLILLPSRASAPLLDGYRALAQFWAEGQSDQIEVRLDREVDALPGDRAIWLFGWENTWRGALTGALKGYDAALEDDGVRLDQARMPVAGHAAVLTARSPANPDLALGWLGTDAAEALPGLGRKLPHYHKYSYLGFEGAEPTNMLKGRWPVVASPMTVMLPAMAGSPTAGGGAPATAAGNVAVMGRLAPRAALAELPPVFSQEKMRETVGILSSPELEGRGFGSKGLEQAANYIADRFREAGLQPGGDAPESYLQSWEEKGGDPETVAVLHNVIGIIPGTKPELAGQSVIMSAHYDHLGMGWPDARAGNTGRLHPGADDNASGVAVLLELARTLGAEWKPDRTVVFIAFAGEEAGRLGSRHYVANPPAFPVDKAIGVVNLDTVGRLEHRKLLVLGTGTAREWIHIFNGAGYVTGVEVQPVAQDQGSSDQTSFIQAGVPAVQVTSGPTADYHRPSDVADTIDGDGLVKVAAVVKEAIDYLAGREAHLTRLPSGPEAAGTAGAASSSPSAPAGAASSSPGAPSGGERRVSLGTVPDFGYTGDGVRLSGTVPGSPAEKGGLQAGDVVVGVGDTSIHSLRDLSEALKSLQPGNRVTVRFQRDGREQRVETEVVAR